MLRNGMYEGLLTKLKNSFTYEFWVKPGSVQPIDQQSREKPANTEGKNYITGPGHVASYDEAGISVSVGRNGITVIEHTDIHHYAVLVYETKIRDFINLAVVYDDGRPYLFINGNFVKSGERSPKRKVFPAGIVGDHLFNGEIKEIRLWDHSRTEEQLKSTMNHQLIGNEKGLYGLWLQKSKTRALPSSTKNSQKSSNSSKIKKKNQPIEVSIIIPSFNKFPLNLFTLYSLEQQTFNPAQMEVIFIDDASTDQTEEKLKDYSPPFHFKYIRNESNLGRAKVRNLGIHLARGSLLIFLDAEMIAEPDFVEKHLKYHQEKDKVILSGVMHSKKIYTCIFPEFDTDTIAKIKSLAKHNKELKQRVREVILPCEEPYPLIEKNHITSKTYKDLVFKSYSWFKTIAKHFNANLEGFMFPWMAFLTGNVSIRKDFIEEAGLFDEDFVQYGYEDWELGYRLYKMGAQYTITNDVITYHQEHPVGKSRWKEAINNLELFISKHDDIDVLILGLELSQLADLITMNKVLKEYKALVQSYSEQYKEFQEDFIHILKTIFLLLQVDIRHLNILGAAGFSSRGRKELQKDINSIKTLKKFTNLTAFLEKVMNS
ncbi:glycosyltransferase [Paenibacillus sp. BSR1-1]|uniref:glycosyltransferase n=1 Tax=Paenibacillus sp. BSR1-1 TaxID=3020845 RepID=UPI0025B1DC6A|nr:glycosyltransferase [Paenibacillus sp. BSR1-1]MDN3019617.1 glycosyltransferase [Paenibacillus sp. BSR1-1]